jgi:putative endonuclease
MMLAQHGVPILCGVTIATQRLGLDGERVAEQWLRHRGWRLLQRRYRSGHRDIDLVAERFGTVAFVEVKTRRGARFGGPVEAVNWKKRLELTRSAFTWIDRHGRSGEAYRFDIIAVLVDGERVRVRHVENAFHLDPRAC